MIFFDVVDIIMNFIFALILLDFLNVWGVYACQEYLKVQKQHIKFILVLVGVISWLILVVLYTIRPYGNMGLIGNMTSLTLVQIFCVIGGHVRFKTGGEKSLLLVYLKPGLTKMHIFFYVTFLAYVCIGVWFKVLNY